MSQLPLCPHCLEPVRSGYHGSCPNAASPWKTITPKVRCPLAPNWAGITPWVNTRAPTATACATAVWIMMNVGLC